jgi:hypothetical protein
MINVGEAAPDYRSGSLYKGFMKTTETNFEARYEVADRPTALDSRPKTF